MRTHSHSQWHPSLKSVSASCAAQQPQAASDGNDQTSLNQDIFDLLTSEDSLYISLQLNIKTMMRGLQNTTNTKEHAEKYY